MPASKAISRVDTNARKLDEMIEEATVDCYDETEQASGLYTMIEENRTVPFKTRILGFGVCRLSLSKWAMTAAQKPYPSAAANGN